MIKNIVVAVGVFAAVLTCGASAVARNAAEDSNPAVVREAAKHFQRGVTLYSEADYHGALVEFQRAYALSPNQVVLYNVGETQYQLREYADALSTFERYLADAGSSDPHRGQVESNIKVLRSRVGQLTIVTSPPGADVSIDDRPIGKTPFDKSIVIGVGHWKVTASMPGRPPATRYVDIAAEDSVSVTLDLAQPSVAKRTTSAGPPIATEIGSAGIVEAPQPTRDHGPIWRTAGWITTVVLTASAVGVGAFAYRESNDLKTARDHFPAMASTLNHKATVTRNLSIVADSLGAAALVVGCVTLYASWNAKPTEPETETRVVVGLGSVSLAGTF